MQDKHYSISAVDLCAICLLRRQLASGGSSSTGT